MNKNWQLRDALYRFFHNWPLLAGCFLLGSLLGWLAGSLWPPYYKATGEVYVALNPYRTYSDARFLALAKPRYANIDNYHYWQMNQLDALLYQNDLLQAVQDRLQTEDSYWNAYTSAELRLMLDADWRTAGDWKLSAFHPDRERAIELSRAWSATAASEAAESITAARDLISIDGNLAAVNAQRQALDERISVLQQAERALEVWSESAADLNQGQPLPAETRWQAYALTSALAVSNPAWDALLEAQPAPDAPAGDFRIWVEGVLDVFRSELDLLPGQAQTLEIRREELKTAYETAAERSRGLSPNLEVQAMGEPQARAVRPRAALALIGGLLGITIAVLAALVHITRQTAGDKEAHVAS